MIDKYFLEDLIEEKRVGAIFVGACALAIEPQMGTTSIPISRLTKKSRILIHQYDNISFLTEGDFIVQISANFHDQAPQRIKLGHLTEWRKNEWCELALRRGWKIGNIGHVVNLIGNGIQISLSPSGTIEFATLN